jgi:hypothetical protein
MADSLTLPDPDLHALADGVVIVAFAPRHAVGLSDELDLVAGGPRPAAELAAAHASLATAGPPDREYRALVVGLQPAVSLGGTGGSAHHILADVPAGDAVILRVFAGTDPVLDDEEFADRLAAVEAAFG